MAEAAERPCADDEAGPHALDGEEAERGWGRTGNRRLGALLGGILAQRRVRDFRGFHEIRFDAQQAERSAVATTEVSLM